MHFTWFLYAILSVVLMTLLVHTSVHVHTAVLARQLSVLMRVVYEAQSIDTSATVCPPLRSHALVNIPVYYTWLDCHVLGTLRHLLPRPTLCHALQGAHVLLEKDVGQFYQWVRCLNGSYARASSHVSSVKVFAVEVANGSLIAGFLDSTNSSWFQMEADAWRPGRAFLPSMFHVLNFVYYAATDTQVGPYGTSRYTERRPLIS